VDVALKGETVTFEVTDSGSFNPCFGGCRSESMNLGISPRTSSMVSILVLVDVALKGV